MNELEFVMCSYFQDSDPEVQEMFLMEITSVVLVDSSVSVGSVPSVRRPGNKAVVRIAENDNAGGIIQFNVQRVCNKYAWNQFIDNC